MKRDSAVIAAFDFDGTITSRDTLVPFVRFTLGALRTYAILFSSLPIALRFVVGDVARQRLKEDYLKRSFAGMHLSLLREYGQKYAEQRLGNFIRPKALHRLRWHKLQGHHCVLISANLDIFLKPWAKSCGFDSLICSQLEVDSQNRVTGKLHGKNCWGEEKTRRLKEQFGEKDYYQLYAYGDSDGDRALLSYADHPYFRPF